MDERTQQIIEDSEKIRDRNSDLESELHGLKVENERLREENEVLFATHGGADPQNLRDALKWVHDQGGIGAVYSLYKGAVLGEAEEALEVLYPEDIEKRLMPEGMEWLVEAWPRFEDGELVKFGDMALIYGEGDMIEAVQLWIHGKPVIYGDCGSQQLERGERVKRPAGGDEHEMSIDNVRAELQSLMDDVWKCADGCRTCVFGGWYDDMPCCESDECVYQMTEVICRRLEEIIRMTEEVENGSQDHSHDA